MNQMETKDKNNANESEKLIKSATSDEYKYGFTSDIDTDIIPVGLNEEVVRLISAKKGEPEWLLDFRLKAFRYWETLKMPDWAHLNIPPIDYQAISYYAEPRSKARGPESLDEVDPQLLDTFNRLGIPLQEQKALAGMAVDAVMDSVSVKTTHREKLAEKGIIFCSISEAVKDYPDLVKNISVQWSATATTFSLPSTRPCSPTDRLSTFPKEYAARWSFRPISASTRLEQASLNAP